MGEKIGGEAEEKILPHYWGMKGMYERDWLSWPRDFAAVKSSYLKYYHNNVQIEAIIGFSGIYLT